jgi:hypothetical protein
MAEIFEVVSLDGKKYLKKTVTRIVEDVSYFTIDALNADKQRQSLNVAETDRIIAKAVELQVDKPEVPIVVTPVVEEPVNP